MDLSLLAGPAALAIAASAAVIALWREHQRTDHLKDELIVSLTKSVGEFPGSLKDLTAVVVEAARRERARRRGEPDES